jgi:hypothetical protein
MAKADRVHSTPRRTASKIKSLKKLPDDEEVLIPLYQAYREINRGLQYIYNMPRSVGARDLINAEQERAHDRAEVIAAKLSQLTSIRSFWTEIYQETLISHVYYTGGNGDDAIRALAKASVLTFV